MRSIRQTIDEREEKLIQLTYDQARVIQFLDEQLHAAIIGAAGTGKTLLAIEKARRLASPTSQVLFLCFNAALCDHLELHHKLPNVRYLTFHAFAREIMGYDGSLEDVSEGLLEYLSEDGELPYDHVIIDEGQDFKKDWLEFLRYRFNQGAFYVFYDRYQTIQGEQDIRWLEAIPCRLVLTRNCRNTDPIAKAAYRAAGLTISPTLGLDGPQPVLHCVDNTADSVRTVDEIVAAACGRHKIPSHDIAVLTMETLFDRSPWLSERIGGKRTTEKPSPHRVTINTVRRFKGLEAVLVIVVDVDFSNAVDENWRRRLYVACSRARHSVHIVTTTKESELKEPIRVLSGTQKSRPSWRSLCRHLGLRQGGATSDPFN